MLHKLYKYTGSVERFSHEKASETALGHAGIVLYNCRNDDIAPVRIEAYGGLAEYVNKLEWTDAEGRYLESNWYYDGNLVLCCIEVPSTNPAVPAKIIAAKDWISREAVTFGPEEFINAMMPEPMSREQLTAWNLFRCGWEYRFPQKS